MVSGTGRKTIAVAGVLAAVAGGAVIARADQPSARTAQATGGLSASPVLIERAAQAGAVNTMTVANNSKAALTVTVNARPWTQSASGTVSPKRSASLAGVEVSEKQFTLAPGKNKDIVVTLKSAPSAGYLYGAVEVVGLPTDIAKRKGVVAGYRILGTLRYNSATPTYSLKLGSAKVVGHGLREDADARRQERGQHARAGHRQRPPQGPDGDQERVAEVARGSCPARRSRFPWFPPRA